MSPRFDAAIPTTPTTKRPPFTVPTVGEPLAEMEIVAPEAGEKIKECVGKGGVEGVAAAAGLVLRHAASSHASMTPRACRTRRGA